MNHPTPALALIILGLALMALEAFVPSFGAAAVIGVIAFGLGAVSMATLTTLPGFIVTWPFVIGFAVFAGVIVVTAVVMAFRMLGKQPMSGTEGMVGQEATVLEWHGQEGRVRVQGEDWRAVAVASLILSAGERVRVADVSNLTLTIEPISSSSPGLSG